MEVCTMAQLKSTNITGNLSVTGNVLASKIIKFNGTSDDILMGDGSTTSKQGLIDSLEAAMEGNSWRPVKYGSTIISDTSTTLEFAAGSNIGLTFTNGKLTIANNYSYSLPLAANGTRGGIQIGYTASGANLPVQLSGEKAYVALTKAAVESVVTIPESFTLSAATSSALGGVKIGFTSTENNRALLLDSEKAYVALPSRLYAGRTDTTSPDAATNSGFYYSSSFPASVGFGNNQGTMFVSSYDKDWVAQIAIGCYTNKMIFRKKGGSWSNWETVATESWVKGLLGTGGDLDLDGYQPKDADLTAIAGLTGTSGLLKKTAANTWTLDTTTYSTFSGSYNDLTNKPTIPAAQIQSDWNQTNTTKADYIKNKPTIPTIPTNVVTGSSLTSDQVILGNGNSTIKASGKTLDKKGNRADGQIVCANGAGSIHSVYYVFTENETARASWGYNASTDCVELAWR